MSQKQATALALAVLGAVCWLLAIYGYGLLGLVGAGAWLVADRVRR